MFARVDLAECCHPIAAACLGTGFVVRAGSAVRVSCQGSCHATEPTMRLLKTT